MEGDVDEEGKDVEGEKEEKKRREKKRRRIGATLRNGALSSSWWCARLARQLAGVNRRNYIEEKLPRDNSD